MFPVHTISQASALVNYSGKQDNTSNNRVKCQLRGFIVHWVRVLTFFN